MEVPTLRLNTPLMLLSPEEPLMMLAEFLLVDTEAAPPREEEVCHDYHERGFDVSTELREK